jgi:glycosyltransferase involved in cell wall biosynthesis
MSEKKKLLILSDSPSASSGLGRICRDLSTRIHANLSDVFDLATAGYGSPGSSKLHWLQYNLEGMSDWVCPTLPDICSDFFGNEKGTILTIWDSHRLTWLSAPRGCLELFGKFPGLQQWAMSRPFDLWGYLPIDSSGPNDRLTFPIMKTLLGFDRLLAYGEFGEGVIRRTIGDEESDKRHLTNLPHGIDGDTFYPLDRELSRKLFLQYTGAQSFFQMLRMINKTEPIADDEVLIHIVATNQNRKDWCCGLEACAILAKSRKIRVWCHLDDLERFWSIPNLLEDFRLLDKTIISLGQISDERMATAYSACDLGLGIGLGEGMGYPIFESLFCGTPCLHINYGGAPQWMQNTDLLVEPVAYRYEGAYASQRPVSNAQDWATRADAVIGKRVNHPGGLDWLNLWSKWEAWFREAVK